MNTEVPPPEVEAPPRWSDNSALKEEKHWADDKKLREAKTVADVWWAKSYGIVAVLLLYVFALLLLGGLVSWSLHYLLPIEWHWLNEDQLSKIQSVIFSSTLGGVASLVAQRQLSK